jgi:hypothetical protein
LANFPRISKPLAECFGLIAKGTINAILNTFVGGYNAINAMWSNLPGAMAVFFTGVVNVGITALEKLLNSWQIGFRGLAALVGELAPEIGGKITKALDASKVKLPRMSGVRCERASRAEFPCGMTHTESVDYVGNAGAAFMNRARSDANARRADAFRRGEIANRNSQLRGTGPNVMGDLPDEKAAKAAQKRADAMGNVNLKLDDELKRMMMLKPVREDEQKFDQIKEELARKHITLSSQEEASIRSKIARIRELKDAQAEMDRMYEEAVGPLRTYNATIAGGQVLLQKGVIDQSKYNQEIAKAAEKYANAIDPMRQYFKALDDEEKLSGMLDREREVETKLLDYRNKLIAEGLPVEEQALEQMRRRFEMQQKVNEQTQAANSLRNQFSGNELSRKSGVEIGAAGTMAQNDPSFQKGGFADSKLGGFMDTQNLYELQQQMQIEKTQQFYQTLNQLQQAHLISERTAMQAQYQFQVRMNNLKLNQYSDFFGGLAQLQTSSNKKIAAIGKAAAIAQALIKTYQSATEAYAAMAGIPYVGPALGVAAAAAAIAAGLANVQAIRSTPQGFKSGGYTGNFGKDQVAGVVHGQEFVMNADATARNRPMLEMLNAGRSLSANDGTYGGGGARVVMVSFTITNQISVQGSGQSSDAESLENSAEAISKKVQADIYESIRTGGDWQKIIAAV